ncbi:MAG: hypothetical protein M1132_05265 [Chloroflexi bacterium]|nr:hypothetical protein [Chloroflexota bacterium]
MSTVGYPKPSEQTWIILLLVIVFASGAALIQFFVPRWLLFLLLAAALDLAICFVIGRDSILGLFVFVLTIGYFQGMIQLLLPRSIDLGTLKYALLLGGGVFWVSRLLLAPKLRFSRGILVFSLLFAVFYALFLGLILRSPLSSEEIRTAIPLWGALNIPLVLLIYFDLKDIETVYKLLRIIVWAGVVATGVGCVEYTLGAARLQALGLNIYDRPFVLFLPGDPSSFRPFSVFPTFYEFASFMTMSFLAQLVLQLRIGRRPTRFSLLIFLILLVGLLMTFHVTSWLTLPGIVAILLWGLSGKGWRIVRSKKLWTYSMLGLFVLLAATFVLPPFRDRVTGIFDVSGTKPGQAGESLFWRTVIFQNDLKAISAFPLGVGLGAESWSEMLADMNNRYGYFFITSDAFFPFLALIGGIPLFLSYLLLWIVPLWSAFRKRRLVPLGDRALFWTIWACLLVGVLLGGISNSGLINGTPTNLLAWASIAVLYRLTSTAKAPRKITPVLMRAIAPMQI